MNNTAEKLEHDDNTESSDLRAEAEAKNLTEEQYVEYVTILEDNVDLDKKMTEIEDEKKAANSDFKARIDAIRTKKGHLQTRIHNLLNPPPLPLFEVENNRRKAMVAVSPFVILHWLAPKEEEEGDDGKSKEETT